MTLSALAREGGCQALIPWRSSLSSAADLRLFYSHAFVQSFLDAIRDLDDAAPMEEIVALFAMGEAFVREEIENVIMTVEPDGVRPPTPPVDSPTSNLPSPSDTIARHVISWAGTHVRGESLFDDCLTGPVLAMLRYARPELATSIDEAITSSAYAHRQSASRALRRAAFFWLPPLAAITFGAALCGAAVGELVSEDLGDLVPPFAALTGVWVYNNIVDDARPRRWVAALGAATALILVVTLLGTQTLAILAATAVWYGHRPSLLALILLGGFDIAGFAVIYPSARRARRLRLSPLAWLPSPTEGAFPVN